MEAEVNQVNIISFSPFALALIPFRFESHKNCSLIDRTEIYFAQLSIVSDTSLNAHLSNYQANQWNYFKVAL